MVKMTHLLPKALKAHAPRGRVDEETRSGDAPETGAWSSAGAAFAPMRLNAYGAKSPWEIVDVDRSRYEETVALIALAFAGDPLFRYLSGAQGATYRRHIRALVEMELTLHLAGGQPLYGILQGGSLLGVAVVEEPGARRAYGAGIKMAAQLWRQTGPLVLLRSLRHLLRISAHRPREPHHRLSLLAVHPRAQGQGYGKALLAEVHARVAAHPTSRGTSLDTENPRNVPLYEHLGYHVTHRIAAGPLTIWSMLRPREAGRRTGTESRPYSLRGAGRR